MSNANGMPEREAIELNAKRDRLLDCAANVALAIQASGRTSVHEDFIEILNMIPDELRANGYKSEKNRA